MATGHSTQHWRTIARATRALAQLLLIVVIVASASLAGRTYLYCHTMRTVMPKACCPGHDVQPSADPSASVVVSSACCQSHSLAPLGLWAPTPRVAEIGAPFVLCEAPRLVPPEPDLARATEFASRACAMRTGPPKSRLHVRLMVFHV
jgi:hypothetical protein